MSTTIRVSLEDKERLAKFAKKVNASSLAETFRKALELLIEMPERLSLCDAASVVLIKELSIRMLASFDLRSFSGLVPNIIGKGYYASLSDEEKKKVEQLSWP